MVTMFGSLVVVKAKLAAAGSVVDFLHVHLVVEGFEDGGEELLVAGRNICRGWNWRSVTGGASQTVVDDKVSEACWSLVAVPLSMGWYVIVDDF